MQVQFFFLAPGVTLKERTRLKGFIVSIFKRYKRKLSHLNYIFCSDEYLLEINKTHLGHDYYTDIITFDLSPKGMPIEGDIYISIDRVRDNAKNLGYSMNAELHRVIFHGALHLCGFKDKQQTDIKKMRKAEDKCLFNYFGK